MGILLCRRSVLLILLMAAAAAGAQGVSSFAELAPIPMAARVAALAEPLSLDTLVDAALAFSGTPDPDMAGRRQAIEAHIVALRREAGGVRDQARLGEMALAYLHKNILRSYWVLQTRIDTALETGSFNCVSSAVLYLILARSLGLSVGGVRTADHAFCTVDVDGAPIDVETTNPYGFNPGTKKEFKDVFGRVTGFSYVPPSAYADRRSIGEKEILALILFNRASGLTDQGRFREALPQASSAYALVGSQEHLQTLLAAVSNYAVWLAGRGDFERARSMVDAVEAAYGADKGLEERRIQLFHNQLITLIDAGSLEEARRLLGQRAIETPLDARDWMDLSVYLAQREAGQASLSGDFAAAGRVISSAMDRLGRQPELLRAYESYVHNQFAALFNSRRFGDARSVLTSGLATYAESSILRQDLGMVDSALRQ